MKTMTCRQLGGSCDRRISGKTPEEIMKNVERHINDNHPDMMKEMKAISEAEKGSWTTDFIRKWNSLPDK